MDEICDLKFHLSHTRNQSMQARIRNMEAHLLGNIFRLLFISFGKQKWHCGVDRTLSAKVCSRCMVFGL